MVQVVARCPGQAHQVIAGNLTATSRHIYQTTKGRGAGQETRDDLGGRSVFLNERDAGDELTACLIDGGGNVSRPSLVRIGSD